MLRVGSDLKRRSSPIPDQIKQAVKSELSMRLQCFVVFFALGQDEARDNECFVKFLLSVPAESIFHLLFLIFLLAS